MVLAAVDESLGLLIQLVVMAVFGGICATIAIGRGRSGLGWFFIGFFAGCIGLILVLVLPDMKVEEARKRQQEMTNRRLREQLAKERQVSDQRHTHLERRLGAHDQALGLDTSERTELLPEQAAGAPPPPLPTGAQWFYSRDKERLGPVSIETLRHLLQNRTIDGKTLVWREGLADWQPLASTTEFDDGVV
jgi:uncharacterized membrane protein